MMPSMAVVRCLLVFFLAGFASSQTEEGACTACDGLGRIGCSQHRASDLALERDAVLCSFYAGCAGCAGTGTLDCASCAPAEDEAGRALRDLRTGVAARFAKYEAVLGRPLLAAASAHFNLVCEFEPLRVLGKRRRHEILHLYLARLEEVQRAYLELFALAETDITARSEFFLWTKKEEHERVGKELCGYTTPDPEYMRGLEAISSIWVDPKKMEEDEALHRNVVHHAVHGLMNVQPPVAWTGKLRMGWADEGLSLWFEDRLLGAVSGFCFWPEDEPRGLRGGKWRPALRKWLAPGEPLDLERLLTLDTVDMTRAEHALGFALVDFLAARDPLLLNRLLERLRARTPPRDAFKEVYGLTLEALEAAWRAWVEDTYPKR